MLQPLRSRGACRWRCLEMVHAPRHSLQSIATAQCWYPPRLDTRRCFHCEQQWVWYPTCERGLFEWKDEGVHIDMPFATLRCSYRMDRLATIWSDRLWQAEIESGRLEYYISWHWPQIFMAPMQQMSEIKLLACCWYEIQKRQQYTTIPRYPWFG